MPRRSRDFGTIDAETDPFHNCDDVECAKCHGGGRIPKPFIWGLYLGRGDRYYEFTDSESLLKFLQDLERDEGGVTFYAHNGGKFDYHYLREHINADEPIMVISGRMAKFKIGAHEFRDSLNIFPNTRLKDFGIKSEIDYEKMEAAKRAHHMPEISTYLKQDCVGLYDMIKRYRTDYGRNLTQAGASMKYWSKMAKREPPRQTRTQYLRLRPFYYGGRVQCFNPGNHIGDFKVYDINSAYPRAMLEKHPISTTFTLIDGDIPGDEERIGPSLIRLKCRSTGGALPLRHDGDLYFPADNELREYCVTGWEFLAAEQFNTLKDVTIIESYVFREVVDFKEYIQYFFAMREDCRKKGDVAGRTFGKYFMNSLYGKFGSNPDNYAEYVIAATDSESTWLEKGFHFYKTFDENARRLMIRKPNEEELEDPEGRWRYYNIATAASVTGWVRAYLFKALHQASGVLYCDTDSIAAKEFAGLDIGTKLGEWKFEGEFDRAYIAGKKLYAYHYKGTPLEHDPLQEDEKKQNWKIASKGVNFKAMADGPELIRRIVSGEEIKFLPQVPSYSVTRAAPQFIPRYVKNTAKNMSQIPSEFV